MPRERHGQARRFMYYMKKLIGSNRFTKDEALRFFESDWGSPIQERQFKEDIKLLKETLPSLFGAETGLEFDRAQDAYLLRQDQEGPQPRKGESISEESRFFPFLHALMEQSELIPFRPSRLMQELTRQHGKGPQAALEGRILYKSTPKATPERPRVMDQLVTSLVESRQVRLDYSRPDLKVNRYLAEPLLFVNNNGAWYLLADARKGNESLGEHPILFKLNRILQAKVTEEPFLRRWSLEDLHREYAEVFGIFLGTSFPEKTRWITLSCTGEAARFMSEAYFHKHQSLEIDPSQPGKIRLRLRVRHYLEAVRLALSWGTQATPLDPPDFVEAWRRAAEETWSHAKKHEVKG